jgi:hypothetical protein
VICITQTQAEGEYGRLVPPHLVPAGSPSPPSEGAAGAPLSSAGREVTHEQVLVGPGAGRNRTQRRINSQSVVNSSAVARVTLRHLAPGDDTPQDSPLQPAQGRPMGQKAFESGSNGRSAAPTIRHGRRRTGRNIVPITSNGAKKIGNRPLPRKGAGMLKIGNRLLPGKSATTKKSGPHQRSAATTLPGAEGI